MAAAWLCGLLLSLLAVAAAASAAAADGTEGTCEPLIRMPTEKGVDASAAATSAAAEEGDDEVITKWALLVAGSSGYGNYRHQVM
jgi:legumain